MPVPAPAAAPVKNVPTKTTSAKPSKSDGEAAQKTLDQAKFETTDSL